MKDTLIKVSQVAKQIVCHSKKSLIRDIIITVLLIFAILLGIKTEIMHKQKIELCQKCFDAGYEQAMVECDEMIQDIHDNLE